MLFRSVGYRDSINLAFDNQIDKLVAEVDDELDFDDLRDNESEKDENIELYPVIDVILAGVES